jgi:N-methylhydantoinase B
MKRTHPSTGVAQSPVVKDVILRAVIANRLDTICQEMGTALERSSRSPIFAEALDMSCGICDAAGDLVSQLNGIPILAAAGTFSVKEILKRYGADIRPGDVFFVNDPYMGGTHLPDIGVITPVFDHDQLVLFCVTRAHHGDIGGAVAGSYNSKATELYQEGIRIPPIRVMTAAGPIQELWDLIALNTRNPQMLTSDLLAQLGACRIGMRRLKELFTRYSSPLVTSVLDDLLKQSERLTREHITRLPDGQYVGEQWLDDDGHQDHPIYIRVTVTVQGDDLLVDFTGTDKQVKGFVNSAFVTSSSAIYMACLWALSPEIPRNSGAFRAIRIHLPAGSLVNPRPVAPVTFSTLTPAGEIITALFNAFSQCVPKRLPADFARSCEYSFYGTDPRDGRFYVGFSFCGLGSGGGRAGVDGNPYMAPISNYGGIRAPNIDANEVQYPHITLIHEFEPDTAGAGTWRGGPGVRYAVKFYGENPHIVMFADGMKIPPRGVGGGQFGSRGQAWIESAVGSEKRLLEGKSDSISLKDDDVVVTISSGGGGWGDPLKRDPQQVRNDVINGIISAQAAHDLYGVVLVNSSVDPAATAARRLAASQATNCGVRANQVS